MSPNNIRNKSGSAESGRAWAKRLTLQSRQARMAVVVVAFALYALAFFALNRIMGPAVVTLALLPLVIAGWFRGMRGGLLAGALCFPLNVLLLNIAGMPEWTVMIGSAGGASGTVLLFFVGGVVGRMSDLSQRAARELAARKQAEEALRESEERLRSTLESMMEGCQIIGYDWRYLFLNDSAAIHGLRNKDELLGHTMMECYPGIEKSDMFAALRRCMEERTPHHMVNEFIYPDGSKGWFELSIQPAPNGIFILSNEVTERKRAEETLRQRLVELETLHAVSAALRAAQTRDEALPILLDKTLAALETEVGVIWLYRPEHDELRGAAARGWFRQLSETPMKPGEGIAGTVFASGQAHVSTELRSDPLARAKTREQAPPGWGGVCLPIRTGAVTIGVLFVSVPSTRQITTEQVQLLESLAEMAGAALHRMRLFEETARQLDQLQALHRVDQAIAASMDLPLTLNILLNQVTAQLNVDAASILLLDPNQHALEYAAGRGFRTDALQHTRLRLGQGYAGRAALERNLIYIPDLRGRKTDFLRSPYFSAEGFVAYYVVPLIAKGQVNGVLEVFHRAPLAAGPDWVSFLETLAGQAAIAIDNTQLFDHLQRSNVDLALAYDATIEGWSRALDLRDRETEGHTLRVTEITLRLAQAMGIGDAELVHIHRGALLHDMGKMGVPDDILHKPDKLTEDEWKLMRLHPQLAYDMLSPINYLRPALDIPYCHHEKWDGTGYPRGLKGEEIPLAARLFAVVDVWDALRSDRPYRGGWPEEKVQAHIRGQAGKHFDPQVVEVFLRMI